MSTVGPQPGSVPVCRCASANAIAALVAVCVFFKGGRETLLLCRDSLADGARTALPVGVACALVGVIIGLLNVLVFSLALTIWHSLPLAVVMMMVAAQKKIPPQTHSLTTHRTLHS